MFSVCHCACYELGRTIMQLIQFFMWKYTVVVVVVVVIVIILPPIQMTIGHIESFLRKLGDQPINYFPSVFFDHKFFF